MDGAHTTCAAGQHLAAFGGEGLESLHILVVDHERLLDAEFAELGASSPKSLLLLGLALLGIGAALHPITSTRQSAAPIPRTFRFMRAVIPSPLQRNVP